jgi:hypothetical protein
MRRQSILVALIATLALSASALAAPLTVKIGATQPTYALGVYSAYYGPLDGYDPVSPGLTAVYMGREAGLIKAGLTIDPIDGIYEDEGLFGFRPYVSTGTFAASALTYVVVNQFGTNPVWMTIEIEVGDPGTRTDNVAFQMVPPAYAPSANYITVNAATATNWLQWTTYVSGITTGSSRTLADIAADPLYAGKTVIRTYLRLGMGDSYGPGPDGTQAWVDKASIGGMTYDFVMKGQGYAQKDWTTNPGYHGFKTP